jgi:hypothetical protein
MLGWIVWLSPNVGFSENLKGIFSMSKFADVLFMLLVSGFFFFFPSFTTASVPSF